MYTHNEDPGAGNGYQHQNTTGAAATAANEQDIGIKQNSMDMEQSQDVQRSNGVPACDTEEAS